jgi:ribosomal protein S27AE
MWRLRACPKCSGDLCAEHGRRSWAENCLQCGYTLEHDGAPSTLASGEGTGRLLLVPQLSKVRALSRP